MAAHRMLRTLRGAIGWGVTATALGCGGASPSPPSPPDSVDPAAGAQASEPTSASSPDPAAGEQLEPDGPRPKAPAPSGAAVAAHPPAAPPSPPPAAPPAEPAPAAESSARPAPAVPGANLTIGALTVDGVEVRSLSCRTSGGGLGGLLGSLTIAAGFGQRKAELDACAPDGKTETEVRWQQRGGTMRDVRALGAGGQRNGCVERALTGAAAPQDAECAAIVVHGPPGSGGGAGS